MTVTPAHSIVKGCLDCCFVLFCIVKERGIVERPFVLGEPIVIILQICIFRVKVMGILPCASFWA